MNEHEFLKITGGIDEGLAAEYGALTPRKRISAKRGVQIAVGVAAAAALAIPAGAYAYKTFIHKDTVDFYMADADRLEEQEKFVTNYVMENEHLRRTVDLQVSDGHNVLTIETQEEKDEIGELFVRNVIQGKHLITYTDGSPGPYFYDDYFGNIPHVGMASCTGFSESADNLYNKLLTIYSCEGIDLDKEIRITYFANDNKDIDAEQYFWKDFPEMDEYAYIFEYDGETDNWLEDFEYVTSFAPNVECVPLHSEDGDEIFMSQFEIFSEGKELPLSFSEFRLILNNGEKCPLDMQNRLFGGEDYVTFGEIIDLDDYAGVEICGVEYLK